jgi:hypothetical protein
MGASLVYLDKPNKDITFEEGESDKMKYVAGDMQGWRINMVSSLPIKGPIAELMSVGIH